MFDERSISITTAPNEDPTRIPKLISSHFQDVFNQRDSQARNLAMKDLYHESIVWFKPDSDGGGTVVRGTDAMNAALQEEMDIYPGFSLAYDGHLSISQNLVAAHWDLGPPTMPDLIKGAHYLLIENEKVKILWTSHLKMPPSPSN